MVQIQPTTSTLSQALRAQRAGGVAVVVWICPHPPTAVGGISTFCAMSQLSQYRDAVASGHRAKTQVELADGPRRYRVRVLTPFTPTKLLQNSSCVKLAFRL